MTLSVSLFFFFFQAEDGIRDRDVTGVQTCALPISAKNAKPNHAPSETEPLLLAGLNLTIDNWHSKIPLWFRKTYLTCWFARSARSHSRSRTKGRASSAESVTASILFGMTFPFCWWTRLSPSPPPEPLFETVATGTDPSVSHNDISCQRVLLVPS